MALFSIKKPFVLTIFGASGDLAKIKIFPTLYELARQKRYPKDFYIVGYARTEMERKAFQKQFKDAVNEHTQGKVDTKLLNELLKHVYYFSGQYTELDDFKSYKAFLKKITGKNKITHITYFSVPPFVFEPIIQHLADTRNSAADDIRLIIEKPFGVDGESAEDLYHFVSQYFEDEQIYLLDHYLGKSAVQSIFHLRRANRMISQMLVGREIANIQITAFESVGVKERAKYFDVTGTVRDMLQSHLLQVMALVTMSIPCDEKAESFQREKHSILSAIHCPCDPANLVLGQYSGYKKEPGVKKNSKTETFAAARLFIDRQDWFGVPIYLRTGKTLHEKHTYVVVEFEKYPFQAASEEPNRLIIELQPFERIHIALTNHHNDVSQEQQITTSDSIACSIEGCLPDHGSLLLDVMRGEKLHFLSFPEILAGWKVVDKITALIQAGAIKPEVYKAGSDGPKSQHKLVEKDGFRWFDLHK